MERLQPIVKNALLAFVLVSLGFVLGKHSARRDAAGEPTPGAPSPANDAAELPVTIRVYYLHATSRCYTCNAIEKMTRELLDGQFAAEIANGRIELRTVDFQKNDVLAKQFDVAANCIVVAKVRGEDVLDHKLLDEIWVFLEYQTEFNEYVGNAIRAYLPEADGGDAG